MSFDCVLYGLRSCALAPMPYILKHLTANESTITLFAIWFWWFSPGKQWANRLLLLFFICFLSLHPVPLHTANDVTLHSKWINIYCVSQANRQFHQILLAFVHAYHVVDAIFFTPNYIKLFVRSSFWSDSERWSHQNQTHGHQTPICRCCSKSKLAVSISTQEKCGSIAIKLTAPYACVANSNSASITISHELVSFRFKVSQNSIFKY